MTDQQYEAAWSAVAWTALVVAWLQPHQAVIELQFDGCGHIVGFKFSEHVYTVGYRWSRAYRMVPDQQGAQASCLLRHLRWPDLFPVDSSRGHR